MNDSEKRYYTDLFVRSSSFSTRHPNADEASRAAAVLPLLSHVAEARARARAQRQAAF
jgi:hypothetical protein